MKSLIALLFLTVMSFILLTTSYAQGGGGEATKKTTPAPAPKSSTPKPPPVVREPAKPKPLTAELTITTNPPGCAVLVDGNRRGVTNSDGLLNLASLKPGRHIVKVQKTAYREDMRTIDVSAGQSQVMNISLSALPGTLNIKPNVVGARIEYSGSGSTGSFNDQVIGQQLAAGQYQLRVSKQGYKTEVRPFEVRPAETVSLSVMLNPVTPAEMLSQAELDFQQKRYRDVIDSCLGVLKSQPDNALANHLLGVSYYLTEKFPESIPPLVRAVKGGREVVLPIKHHHRGPNMGMDDALCSGKLTFRKDSFAFNSSDVGGHDFNLPYNKIYEIKQEAQKAGRLNLKIGIPKGNKEERKDYNFHVAQAQLVSTGQNGAISRAVCNDCQRAVEMLYQLLQQLRQ